MSQRAHLFALAVIALLGQNAFAQSTDYDVRFTIDGTKEGEYRVQMMVSQPNRLLREVRVDRIPDSLSAFEAKSGLTVVNRSMIWSPSEYGGALAWTAKPETPDDSTVHHDPTWAMLRFEDLIPPMATRTLKSAATRTRVVFNPPPGWSVVSAYPARDNAWVVDDDARRFDLPKGWLVMGELAVRRDRLADTRIAIAAPQGIGARQLDVMAFVAWHLPSYKALFPNFPDRLLIAMAGDPMFRGGLSAPNSLFLHSDRPLISGNGTSTLLHELVHIGVGRSAADGADWIVEGLAEYYSQELLARSGSITRRRQQRTLSWFEEYSQSQPDLRADSAQGPVMWRAVGVFAALDQEIRATTNNEKSLDDVVKKISQDSARLTLAELRQATQAVIGAESTSLSDKELDFE
ncbi:MAG: hypothetical protein AAF578_11175 [Pseudomonadota bacterium]